jgi:regulator of sirC expression with transglutaminase-like and TPR domain
MNSYFASIAVKADQQIDLAEAALQIALEEYPSLDVAAYLSVLDGWSEELKKRSLSKPNTQKIQAVNDLLFQQLAFKGNIDDYYDPKNSFLNDVIDRKIGIPITLSLIYLELAWSLGIEAHGIGFPGHFLVRAETEEGALYIDAFHHGNTMTLEGCREFWSDLTEAQLEFDQSFLHPVGKRQILCRMLRNLKAIYLDQRNYAKLIAILDLLVTLNPTDCDELRDRGIVHYQMESFQKALQDFEAYLSIASAEEDTATIHQYIEILRHYKSRLN